GTKYDVRDKADATFKLSDTPGGLALDIAASGSALAVLDPEARQIAGFTKQDYPQGSGTGTITVSKNGTIKLVASLADGTATTVSSTLSSAYQVALFGQTFPAATTPPTYKGFISALVK